MDLLRKSVSRSLASGDTVPAAAKLVGMAFANWRIGGSKEQAENTLRDFDRLTVPKTVLDVWGPRTILGILLDPDREYDPEVGKTPTMKTFFGMFVLCVRGSCQEGSQRADSIVRGFPNQFKLFVRSQVADCFYRAGRYNDALSAINAGLAYRSVATNGNYPTALVLQGKIQEAMGNRNDALATYGKFLTLWKDADPDLPILVDVKKRVAALKAVSTN